MPYIPEEMRINDFIDVAIPQNKTFFQRLGNVSVNPSSYTGDESISFNQSKVDELDAYERYAEQMAKELK